MTREEAREILTHNWTRVDNPNYSESELDEAFFMAIEALSVANLKSEFESTDAVQGEWIDVENEPYCECSVCGSYIDNLDDDYDFCPRCGARMKGGAE